MLGQKSERWSHVGSKVDLGEENLNELSQEHSDNAPEQENTMPVIDENKTEDLPDEEV